MKKKPFLICLLFVLCFAPSWQLFAQTNVVITEVSCPDFFPLSYVDLSFDITVENTGDEESVPQELFLYQAFLANGPAHLNQGSVSIPALGVGEVRNLSVSYDLNTSIYLPGVYPRETGANTLNFIYGDFFLSFEVAQFPEIAATIDFYCKKYEADLEIEIIPISPEYGADGLVRYIVNVTNNSTEPKYNVAANLFSPAFFSNSDFSSVYEVDDNYQIRPTNTGRAQWWLTYMAPGFTYSRILTFKLLSQGPLPEEYIVEVSVGSGHLIADDDPSNNTDSYTFTKGESTCSTSLPRFTELGELDNHKYYLSDNIYTWLDAQATAEANEGYLATITSEEENEFLQQHISDIVFIGLNDAAVEGSLSWENGEPLGYNNASGFNSEDKDYGTINFWNGGWGFENVWVAKKFILEIDCGSGTAEQVDLELTMEIDPPNSLSGGLATISVTNQGPGRATGIIVQRSGFLTSLVYPTESLSHGAVSDSDWFIGILEEGETATWQFYVYIVDQYHTAYVYAQVIAVDQDDPDSTPNSDEINETTNPDEDDEDRILIAGTGGGLPGSPDLEMTVNTPVAEAGEEITLTLFFRQYR